MLELLDGTRESCNGIAGGNFGCLFFESAIAPSWLHGYVDSHALAADSVNIDHREPEATFFRVYTRTYTLYNTLAENVIRKRELYGSLY